MMRGLRSSLPALAVVVLASAASAAPLVPVTRTLPNGVRVAVLRDPRLPLVGLQLTVPAGSASERLGEAGAAHMVAELVRRGTVSRAARAFAVDVERLGGNISTSSGRDFAAVSGLFLARDLDAAVGLVADAASHAIFVDAEIEPLRAATSRAIAQQLGSPPATAEDAAWLSAFGWTGYGRPPLGTALGVSGLKRDALQAFYARTWRPERAVLAIAGDVDPERAFRAAEEWLGEWRGAPASSLPPAPSAVKPSRVRIIDRADLDEAEIRIALTGPRRGDEADMALRVLGRVLAGEGGSRLERARAAGAPLRLPRAGYVPLRDAGLFQVAFAAAPESAGAAVRGALDALEGLRSSAPTEAELDPARDGIAGAYSLQLETLGQVLAQWSGVALAGLPDDELARAPAKAKSVDAAAAQAAARRWLTPEHAVIVVLGPAEGIKPQLASLGTVEVVQMKDLAAETRPVVPRAEFTAEQEKRGRDLVQRAIKAHGGLSKLKGVRSSILGADVTLTMDQREVVGTFQQMRKEPYRMLYVTTLEGLNLKQVLNGAEAWSVDPSSGSVQEADSVQLRALRNGFDSDVPHILLGAERSRVGAVGTTQIDGRDVETVEVRSPSGARRLHLERKTYRLVAMDQNDDLASDGFEARRVYRDYRTVAGLVVPHEEDRLLAGERVMRLKLTRLEINPVVEDASFLRPEEPLTAPSR